MKTLICPTYLTTTPGHVFYILKFFYANDFDHYWSDLNKPLYLNVIIKYISSFHFCLWNHKAQEQFTNSLI